MDVDAVIAALGERFDLDEAASAERMLREYAGTMPDQQLIEEIGLAIAIHRRGCRGSVRRGAADTGSGTLPRPWGPHDTFVQQPASGLFFA